ncbi:MAG: amino acid adenylation domain-containing protein [Thermoanaerobaculia bacterium]
MLKHGTFVDVLRRRASERPDQRVYSVLTGDGAEVDSLTYVELERSAASIAAALRAVAAPGDRALLLHAPGIDFIASFFGCLLAGVAAVPAHPPQPRRDSPRLRAIARDAAPRVVLTTSSLRKMAGAGLGQAPELAEAVWIAVDELPARAWNGSGPAPDSIAFLQYTSGSTALPKGVMVTHANLMHNERMIRAAFEQDEESVVVGWLPLYHDMGLIGNVLQPLFCGGRCVLMSPAAFLQRPRRWLEAISRYRATTSGGPNFAYDLCVSRIPPEARQGLDLSSWRVAYNGAEPVRAETLDRFAAAFGPSGFRRESFYPCYGLAEATLFVAGGVPGRGARVKAVDAASLERHEAEPASPGAPTRRLVSCGEAWEGQRIAVVDPESGAELPAGRIGEIWVGGASVALGYWNRPEQTEHDFRAILAGEAGGRGFLRTGDLGFVEGGELFVTGRLKDLVILRGRNHYPQDLELTAERAHPGLRSGCGAAFAVDLDGEERLVLVCEIQSRPGATVDEIAGAVRRSIAEEHEVQVFEVVLVQAATIPKTSSGKIQRQACRAAYLAGSLTVVGASALPRGGAGESEAAPLDASSLALLDPAARLPALLADLERRVTRLLGQRPDPSRPLTELGLDSLAAFELKAEVEAQLGVPVPLARLSGGCSLRDLADLVLLGGEVVEGVPPLIQLTADARRGPLPLTVGQKALWFLEQLNAESAAYNIAGAALLPDGADPEILRRAFQSLMDRHPALRTTFADGPEGPRQRVLSTAGMDFRRERADGWTAEELRRRLHDQAFRPFDLETGPLFRAALFSRGLPAGKDDILVLAVHHLVADLWSLALLARDLGTAYDAFAAGLAAAAPPAPALEYGDYAAWQEEALAAGMAERHWEGWWRRLAGVPPLELPVDHPRPAVPGHRAAVRSLRLDAGAATALHALANRSGGTLFMVLLAGFQALLGRYSGQEDFLTGALTNGRSAAPGARLTDLVGYFVNPVALRADLGSDPRTGEWLERVRAAALGAFEHQDFPYPWLAERLQAGAGREPLLRAVLTLQKAPVPELEALAAFALGEAGARLQLGGLTLESVALAAPATQFEVTLLAAELDGGIAATLQLDADLFDAATAERMLGHLANLLEGLADTPERRLSELALLTASELRQLAAWDEKARHAHPRHETLHGLFVRQARLTPEATALVAGGARLTYAELERRSGRVAARLAALGVGPEVAVGVCMERTADLVTALLGVLRAGGFYLPLDPRYPAERLSFLATDSGARWVVVDEASAGRVPAGPERLRLEELERGDGERSAGFPEAVAGNLAYLIYTSGSTGRPKGVAVEHRSAALLAHWARERFGRDLEGLVASTSVTFDLSVFELFAPLAAGGTVILVRDALALPEARLPAGIEARLLNTVPSAAAELVRLGALPATVRTVCLAGESLMGSLVDALHGLGTVERVFNLYGPTEDTVYSTGELVAQGTARPSIGRPLPGTRERVVDRWLSRTPVVGVPGELCLAGEGLARGYLGRPELTAERFVPDPFGEAGDRMYRTGDLVRRLADGGLDFLGRIDQQVKIRGFRVEPGEIEALLAEHPGVREVAVAVQETGAGERRLVACVVPSAEGTAVTASLRPYLAARLPEHMVPSLWVELEALPRTPNGKLDRRGLASQAREYRVEGGEAAPPRTPVEEVLAGIWMEVLGIAAVGRTDSFFHLGGHSLVATRVTSRVRRALGVELPLRALFETPTLAALGERVERALRESVAAEPPLVARGDRGAAIPLSFAQERLWFLHQLAPGGSAYNVPGTVFLRGRLEPAALAASLTEIVRRHEALRTRFVISGGSAAQEILPPAPSPLPLIDLSALPPGRRQRVVRERLAAEAELPFDLARGPLARALLLRLDAAEHALAVTLHHIASDGWSLGVLVHELSVLYGALMAGHPSPLSEPPVQYADFAVWQRGWFSGGALERQLAYWRQRLAGAPRMLDLPADHPPPPAASQRGGGLAVPLPAGVTEELRRLARRGGGTLFIGLLAGFQALLARVTGQEDLLVGSPVANRTRVEVEGLIGCFVNTLVLRGELAGDPPFEEFLDRARETALGAYAHQDLPFERLVEELAPERDLTRSPLVQALLVLQNAPLGPLELPGLVLTPIGEEGGAAKFELTLTFTETADGLAGLLVYARDRFEASTAGRMMRHLETLLATAVAEPGRRLSELPLLGAAESHQLLREWNDTAAAWPAESCLHELIAAQAGRAPETVALSCAEGELTYRELDRAANRLARQLQAAGVGPETVVGVLAERSLELVVGLLAVLKAGGAYLPLDPDHPPGRLGFMLADAAAPVVLAQARLLARLPAARVRVVPLDGAGEAREERGGAPPASGAVPDGLAYVIYTSGSTGRPKGTMNTHRGIVNRLLWMQRQYRLGDRDRVLQKTPFSFDVSVWELFWPLLTGARLVIARPGGHQDPAYLARTIREAGITTLHFVPSMLQVFLEAPGVEDCAAVLRRVVCSGEALPPELARRFFARLAAVALHNLYGPTEAAVDVTSWACEQEGWQGLVPIGRPVANTWIHVVDRELRPVPIGVAGELLIGGVQVCRGYLGRPELTAERFVPDPLSGVAGARLYRTGDLARQLAVGAVDFLGRTDHQVKVRGLRIELGEIESALGEQPAVREAVVVARAVGEGLGAVNLVAYVTVRRGMQPPSLAGLRERLASRLPEYMLPAALVVLASMPLTASGKVDRKALPAPEWTPDRRERVAPRTAMERSLAGLWSETLKLPEESFGVHDNFFALGGNSISGAILINRLQETLGESVQVVAIFDAPTVAGLAALLARNHPRAVRRLEPADAAPGRPRPLSFSQERLWFLHQLEPWSTAYSGPGRLTLRGRLDVAALAASLGEIVRRQEVLRTTFASVEGRPVQTVSPAGRLPLPLVDLSGSPEPGAEADRLAAEDAALPFDLARGPLFRATLLRLAGDCHHLIYNLHHIVGDGWSTGVIIREIGILYTSLSQARPALLPKLPIQYADYAAWQRAWLSGAVLESRLAYWKQRLAGELPALRLPVEPAAAAAPGGARRELPLAPDLSAALGDLSRREAVTPFMTLLAGFKVLLHRYTGLSDIVVGTAVAGRDRPEVEGLVGFFVNMLVMRTDLSGNPRFRELLARVREVAVGAYAHQDLPFEKLVEELGKSRDRSLFQIAFGVQNAHSERLELPGLEVRADETGAVVPRFDLTVWVVEGEDGLRVSWTYRTEVFSAAAVERMHGRFERLLRSAVERPEERIQLLEMLPDAERAERAAEEKVAERQLVEQLFNVRRRRVHVPRQESAIERTPEKGNES